MEMIYNVKFHQNVLCHFHGDETLITKIFFIYKFSLPLNTTSPMEVHWNEFYEKNKMIEVGQA